MGTLYRRGKSSSNVDPKKTYVFIFLGEFGYELLDWQGKIRYLKKCNPEMQLNVASRISCRYLYNDLGQFFPLDSSVIYINSKADSYFARPPHQENSLVGGLIFSLRIHRSIKTLIHNTLPNTNIQLVFSDRVTFLEEIQFGANIILHGQNLKTDSYATGIYETVTVNCNDLQIPHYQYDRPKIIESDYILFMKAERSSHNKDLEKINVEDFLESITTTPITKILMEYKSDRSFDGRGSIDFNRLPDSIIYRSVETLAQQIELIQHSKYCVFFTQGDLRSHTYLPPLIGKDVYVVSSNQVANFSYIEHWNEYVFNFGGKIKMIGPKKEDFIILMNKLVGQFGES